MGGDQRPQLLDTGCGCTCSICAEDGWATCTPDSRHLGLLRHTLSLQRGRGGLNPANSGFSWPMGACRCRQKRLGDGPRLTRAGIPSWAGRVWQEQVSAHRLFSDLQARPKVLRAPGFPAHLGCRREGVRGQQTEDGIWRGGPKGASQGPNGRQGREAMGVTLSKRLGSSQE